MFEHAEKSISETFQIKPNLDCNYRFPIDLTRNGIPFDVKSTGKV